MIPGLDVHAGYGVIDWQKVKDAGYRFAWLKCTEGNQGGGKFVDGQYARNVEEATKHGVVIGAYHFGFPLPEDGINKLRSPEEQAEIAFRNSKGLGSRQGELSPVIDAEWPEIAHWKKWGCTAPQMSEWFRRYCLAAEDLWCRPPVIYTYPNWWRELSKFADTSWAANYSLWYANYTHTGPGIPPDGANPPLLHWVSKTWKDWAVWQHSADGSTVKVPGINAAAVDRNVIKDEATFWKLQGYDFVVQ